MWWSPSAIRIWLVTTLCALTAPSLGVAEDIFRTSLDSVLIAEADAPGDLESSVEDLLSSENDVSEADNEENLAGEIRALRSRLDQLERAEKKRIEKEQKKQAEEQKKKEADAKKPAGKSDDKPKDNVWTDVSDEKWTVRLGGHIQMDLINWAQADPAITGPAANPPARDYFEFRRLRLLADGTGYGVYDFRLQMTLEPETSTDSSGATVTDPQVKDAYFSINEIPWIGRVRVGNFFVPFGLEQVTNDTNNIFLERSVPTQGIFTADREVGVAAYNVSADQSFTWTYGAFLDSISESLKQRVDNNQGYRLSSRITWLPYYDELSNGRYLIHTGAGLLHTHDQDGLVRFAARPQIRLGPRLVDTGNLKAGDYTTGNLELAVVFGPVTVQSEAYLSRVNLNGADPVNFHGAYVHLSWFLTGENRIYERFGQHGAQFGRNVPFTTVFATPSGCGYGAWEAKARWSYLDLHNTQDGRYDDVTVGLNWYWSDRTRVMFDYIHPITSRDSVFGSTHSDILGTRFDVNW